MPEVDKYPLQWKLQALAYSNVMEKVKPFIEENAEFKARVKTKERAMLDRAIGKRG